MGVCMCVHKHMECVFVQILEHGCVCMCRSQRLMISSVVLFLIFWDRVSLTKPRDHLLGSLASQWAPGITLSPSSIAANFLREFGRRDLSSSVPCVARTFSNSATSSASDFFHPSFSWGPKTKDQGCEAQSNKLKTSNLLEVKLQNKSPSPLSKVICVHLEMWANWD